MAHIQKQIEKAVSALYKHEILQKKKQKAQLIEDDSLIWLQVTFFKVPAKAPLQPPLIPLPHPVWTESDVCLFVRDPQKEWRKLLLDQNVAGLAKVNSLKKLRANYKTYEQKRQLANTYDLFLCDEAGMGYMPKLLGKEFFRRKKHPLAVKLGKLPTAPNAAHVSKALSGTSMTTANGTCTSVRVARFSMT